MYWVKREGTTAKSEMNLALYNELVLTWKKKIAEAVFEYKIHSDLILNFDQKPFGFAVLSKTTHAKRNSQNVLTDLQLDNRLVSSKSEISFGI